MSINADIVEVRQGEDSGIWLKHRDAPDSTKPTFFRVMNRPCPNLHGLVGCHVWGGDSEFMIGETMIAHREGYTKIWLIEHPPIRIPASRAIADLELDVE